MRRRIYLLLGIAGSSLILSTALLWLFERGNPDIESPADLVWWWVETSATVGYGDIVPLTWPGRIVAMFTILTGFFVFANLVALAAESAHAFVERRHRGTARVTSRDHVVICEYTSVADELIQSLASCEPLAGRDVVIVSDLVETNPYPEHRFVRGVPISSSVLRQAGVEHAAYVFVFANLRFADPDVKTLHVALRVARLNPRARIMVELADPGNDLLAQAPERFRVAGSRELIRALLQGKGIDALAWIGLPEQVPRN